MVKKKTGRKKRIDGELTSLDKMLDIAIRLASRARDRNQCVWCGSRLKLNTAHVIPKRNKHALRWDMLNVMQLCYRCHLERWHKDPLEAAAWFRSEYPDRAGYLEARRGMDKHFTVQEKHNLLKYLNAMEKMYASRK